METAIAVTPEKPTKEISHRTISILSVLIVLAIWTLSTNLGWVSGKALPSPLVPSVVTFTLSPSAVYVTVVFFIIPAGIFDLASLSFHVPICGF